MPRYLVTGGCGFIGRHLTNSLLQSGADVVVLDDLSTGDPEALPQDVRLAVGDIRDESALHRTMEGCDGCFHLAAVASVSRCRQQWAKSHDINLYGTVRVLETARDLGGIPVVYASSAAVYGDSAALPLNESAPPHPISSYGVDKLGCELQARAGGRAFGLPTAGLRFFNVFGPGQDPRSPYSGVISIFLDRLLQNREIEIFGDGGQTRDFVYVRDVVRALTLALRVASDSAPVFNVCTGRGSSIVEVAEELFALRSRKAALGFGPARQGDIRHSLGDPIHAAAVLGFRSEVTLADGLASLLRHMRDRQPALV